MVNKSDKITFLVGLVPYVGADILPWLTYKPPQVAPETKLFCAFKDIPALLVP